MPLKAVLNNQTFFKFWACRAFSIDIDRLSYSNGTKARIRAIAFGIFTLGIGTLICKACLFDRKVVSSSETLKFHKLKLEKIFASSNNHKKLEALNNYFWDYYQNFYDAFDLVSTTNNIYDYICENKIRHYIAPELKIYFEIRKFCDLLNQGNKNKELVNLLKKRISSWGHDAYCSILRHCDFEKVTCYMLDENSLIKEEFIAHFSNYDFTEFREKYNLIKNLALQNFLLAPPTQNKDDYGDCFTTTSCNKTKTMSFVCEVLDALDCEIQERDLRMKSINCTIRPILLENKTLLWDLLAVHCKLKHIPFLKSYRFGFINEAPLASQFNEKSLQRLEKL